MISMSKFTKLIQWTVGLFALALLIAHTFQWSRIQVDAVTILLLAVIALIPIIELIRKIKIGEFEAEIASREVAEASAKIQKEAPTKSTKEQRSIQEYPEVLDIVKDDPQLGLAKLRMELERVLKMLYTHSFPSKKQKLDFLELAK